MNLKEKIRVIENFPSPGISFKDITPLLQDPLAFKQAVDLLVEYGAALNANLVIGPEARGFAIGAPVAYALGIGFIPVRKAGKLPYQTLQMDYDLEYGHDRVEIHQDALSPSSRVLIIDDLLATGGTVSAVTKLISRTGATIVGIGFIIELTDLLGRSKISSYDVHSLIQYDL